MSLHIVNLAKLKGRIDSEDFDPKTKDKYLCMDSIMHGADISNPFKSFTLYELWAKRVLDEFWNQVFFNNNYIREIWKERKKCL